MTPKANQAKVSLLEFKGEVDNVLESIFDSEIKIAKDFTQYAVDYVTELKNIALVGGKRLRPSFVYYTYLMHGGKNIEEIMKIAAAIEIVHVFLLVEDDFIDIAETRRGYKTIHEKYKEFHTKNKYKKDPSHFGNSIAVNVGIIADHMAINTLNNSSFDPELKRKAMNRLNRQIITTGHGQIHDILNEVRYELTEDDILNVLYWKTGIYTYDNPIQIGAILAGASQQELLDLSSYAIPGGVAFQIQDDILGSFGDSGVMGKPGDGDIKEGKQTLLTYKAIENGSKKDKEVLAEVLGKEDASDDEVQAVRDVFVKTGALEYSKDKAIELVKQAKKALIEDNFNPSWKQEGVDYLEGIADYMIDREL